MIPAKRLASLVFFSSLRTRSLCPKASFVLTKENGEGFFNFKKKSVIDPSNEMVVNKLYQTSIMLHLSYLDKALNAK